METAVLLAEPATSTIELELTFHRLSNQWKRETGHLSNLKKKCAHPCYQEIIRIGEPALPFILDDLEKTYDDWFVALKAITGADPIAPEIAGNIPKMTEVWSAALRQ